jgi:tRNA-Thr(GGU) m(6)t(6)A37 methyltransferase TsaA
MQATVRFIGRVRTPWQTLEECPRNVSPEGPSCSLEIEPAFVEGLRGLRAGDRILVLYWLDRAERETLLHQRRDSGPVCGVFALRSPHRPNPIGAAIVRIEAVAGRCVRVSALDCLDGTPLLDIKPALRGEGPVPGTAPDFLHN